MYSQHIQNNQKYSHYASKNISKITKSTHTYLKVIYADILLYWIPSEYIMACYECFGIYCILEYFGEYEEYFGVLWKYFGVCWEYFRVYWEYFGA